MSKLKSLPRHTLLEAYARTGDPEIVVELNRRNRSAIFKACCRVLKTRFGNQFRAAAVFADAAMLSTRYFCNDVSYEIDGRYTKTGNPYVVYFE